jgi:hypothetical protein
MPFESRAMIFRKAADLIAGTATSMYRTVSLVSVPGCLCCLYRLPTAREPVHACCYNVNAARYIYIYIYFNATNTTNLYRQVPPADECGHNAGHGQDHLAGGDRQRGGGRGLPAPEHQLRPGDILRAAPAQLPEHLEPHGVQGT